jgi:RNA methyltransferase, TrmH family
LQPAVPLSDGNARLVAARRLTRRSARAETGRFLVEGVPGVREALRHGHSVVEVFATQRAVARHPDVLADVPLSVITERTAASLSETTTPQGVVAVCRRIDVPLADAFAGRPQLVVGLVEPNDPGNLGTILRTADAAGADALVVAGTGVDLYNGKAVRASAGSLFHVPLAVADPAELLLAARSAGLQTFATSGTGDVEISSAPLPDPTLWLFGNEAHGLPPAVLAATDAVVRIPIFGRAESLNLAAAAAVCLYASAFSQRSASQ